MLLSLNELILKQFQIISPPRTIPLHSMISSVGYAEERKGSYDWHGLRRGNAAFTLFQWTVSGRGRLECGGREQELLPGQAMLLQIPHDHRYYLPRDSSHWRFIYVCFYGSEIRRLMKELLNRNEFVWNLAFESEPVQTAMRIHREATHGNLDSPFTASALAYELAMHLGNLRFFPRTKLGDRFASVRNQVEKHLAEEWDVSRMAEFVGMSRFHFTRQFTLACGSSPGEYLLQTRVKRAAQLLANPRLSIKEISVRSGFCNANYLSKVFRRVLGISPREFRRSGMYSLRNR